MTTRVQLNYGETLQEFAARTLGDASQWAVIATLNNLAPPYASPVPGTRLAVYGDTLLVPSSSLEIEPSKTSAEEILKSDVSLLNGHLQATATGDIALVSGRQNLHQALGIRVTTGPGELLFHLDYGCQASLLRGEKATPTNALLAKSYVEKAVAEDPRVASVTGAKSSISGDAVRVDVQCASVTGHPVNTAVTV